ncbi:biotin transporter BioY [Mammaliicoccus stepanovicii]|uniref:Biotin transporter n=1 Tax=Mammaliicoccus stepanovicii TaxID=643214 RepID=A0A239YJ39_9STAP|nr:biotin transporter BioY [Mammaliicoccus stepanovicii]PNZ77877.1 biotin transporter BioY [Mammaliicoccus stepanovicii]GGI40927.1 biotin biosynthesis protein BioY [Mammaliicoccus stepanovicii]SNV58740.1 BioY family protein [Mammaliicoccus stepanovicii]
MKTKDIVIIAMFTAFISVMAFIPPIPLPFMPVPIVLQSIGIMLAGCLLGAKRGTISVIVFLLLVAIGLPLLSGGKGGMGVFFGPTAGYIISFPFIAFFIGYFIDLKWRSLTFTYILAINIIFGVVLLNLVGGFVMGEFMNISILNRYILTLTFLPGDIIKAILATMLLLNLKNLPELKRLRTK